MLTTRKLLLLVATVFLLTFLLLRQSSGRPGLTRGSRPHRVSQTASADGAGAGGKTREEIEALLRGSERPYRNADEFEDVRDHLEWLFPYAGAGGSKFPAYIWQTWKSTPSMEEFDERFRMTEASWTENHPDYVHEVGSLGLNPPTNVYFPLLAYVTLEFVLCVF